MIYNQNPRIIFFYRFQPLMPDWRVNQDDEGFALTVTEDGRAYFSHFVHNDVISSQFEYHLSDDFRLRYLDLMKRSDSWLGGVPQQMELPPERIARYRSFIGLDGYSSMFIADDIAQMTHLPYMDAYGRCARRLCSMMEDISELLMMQGITLLPWGYNCDRHAIQLVSAAQPNVQFTTPNAIINF